jgi:hypothetical protein
MQNEQNMKYLQLNDNELRELRRRDIGTWRGKGKRGRDRDKRGHHFIINEDFYEDNMHSNRYQEKEGFQ